MSEANPNHPVTSAMRDQWHKIAALLIAKQGITEVVITPRDLEAFLGSTHINVAIQELEDGLHIRLLDEATITRLARQEGGLPT